VRQAALAGLSAISDEDDLTYLGKVETLLKDPDLEVRTQALIPLLRTKNTSFHQAAEKQLLRMLDDADPKHRARAIRILGTIQKSAYTTYLAVALTDSSDEVRLEAALAFESLLQETIPEEVAVLVTERMNNQVDDPIERVRLSALIVLGKINHEDSIHVFIKALTDHSPQVRSIAVDTLAQTGKTWMDEYVRLQKVAQQSGSPSMQQQIDNHLALPTLGKVVLPTLQQCLGNPKPQLQRMAAVVLSRINQEQFEPLLKSLINDTLLTIYITIGRIEALSPYAQLSSVAVMLSAMREYNQQLLEEIFYILAAINKRDTIQVVIDALRSEDEHIRANAIEALESLTSPQVVWLIEPLFDTSAKPHTLLEMSQEMWGVHPIQTVDAIEHLMNPKNSAWLRTMMTFALGEIGSLGMAAPVLDNKPHPNGNNGNNGGNGNNGSNGGRGARRKRLDLFSALTDTPDQPTAPEANKPLPTTTAAPQLLIPRSDIELMIQRSLKDPNKDVRLAAQAAHRKIQGRIITDKLQEQEEDTMLSTIERIIFLKGVPFFQGMTVDQLKVLATVCEEQFFAADTRIFSPGEPGGALYMVISGKVAIEQEKRKGYFARLATMEAHAYFGEESLFDNIERSTAATAIQDTMSLRLQREPLIALARQHPTLSLELISVLSQRLRLKDFNQTDNEC
jgi:HEAT repeat protein